MGSKIKRGRCLATVMCAGALLAPSVDASARVTAAPSYQLIDIGTFGGRQAFLTGPAELITSRGAALGSADSHQEDSANGRRSRSRTVPVGNAPVFAAENHRTHTLYVANVGDSTVSVVDVSRCSSLRWSGCARTSPTIELDGPPLGVAVDEATDTLYVTNPVDASVGVIDGSICNAMTDAGCGRQPHARARSTTWWSWTRRRTWCTRPTKAPSRGPCR